MPASEEAFARLTQIAGQEFDPTPPVSGVVRLLAEVERQLEIVDAQFRLVLPEQPHAFKVIDALDILDRESRRIATAFEREIQPPALRGRGVQLRRRAEGLQITEAQHGSPMDFVVLLGGLYQTLTSQPVSFGLNLAALVTHGHAFVARVRPRTKSQPQAIKVRSETRDLEFPSDGKVLLNLKEADGSALRFAYFPGDEPVDLPDDFFKV